MDRARIAVRCGAHFETSIGDVLRGDVDGSSGVAYLLRQTNLDEGRDRSLDVTPNFAKVEYTERVRWGRFDGVGLSMATTKDGDTMASSRVRIASSSFRYGTMFHKRKTSAEGSESTTDLGCARRGWHVRFHDGSGRR